MSLPVDIRKLTTIRDRFRVWIIWLKAQKSTPKSQKKSRIASYKILNRLYSVPLPIWRHTLLQQIHYSSAEQTFRSWYGHPWAVTELLKRSIGTAQCVFSDHDLKQIRDLFSTICIPITRVRKRQRNIGKVNFEKCAYVVYFEFIF